MRETLDTNARFADTSIPDGEHEFEVKSVTKKYGKKDVAFYVWTLLYKGGKGEQVLLPSMMGDLLRVLGCTETTKGHFEWDPELMEGKFFKATVSHEPDKKDPNITRQQMTGFQKVNQTDDVPF